MSSRDEIDPRYDDLVQTLRGAKPDAPHAVRERVRSLGQPTPRARFPRPTRRTVLFVSPVAAGALGLVLAFVVFGSSPRQQADRTLGTGAGRAPGSAPQEQSAMDTFVLESSNPITTAARVSAIVRAAGGTVAAGPTAHGRLRLALGVPSGRAEEVLAKIARLGKTNQIFGLFESRRRPAAAPKLRLTVVVSRAR